MTEASVIYYFDDWQPDGAARFRAAPFQRLFDAVENQGFDRRIFGSRPHFQAAVHRIRNINGRPHSPSLPYLWLIRRYRPYPVRDRIVGRVAGSLLPAFSWPV